MDGVIEDAAPTLTHRIVLLAVASLAASGETPAHSGAIRSTCVSLLATVDDDPLGTLAEADTVRAVNELEAADVLAETDPVDRSPVGKGRPRYDLAVDADRVLAGVEGDDRLADLAATVREDN